MDYIMDMEKRLKESYHNLNEGLQKFAAATEENQNIIDSIKEKTEYTKKLLSDLDKKQKIINKKREELNEL
jgi:predicted transcriptional regulator